MTRTSVVVATRNRRDELLRTLGELQRLPERPPVVVVDNDSSDGTVAAVRDQFPDVDLVVGGRGMGPASRNLGVAGATTPYIAFADDDSWWAPGSLSHAADLFDRHPRLGLLTGRVLVGPDEQLDPTSRLMADSPLARDDDAPGVPVLGFLGCAGIVRRRAFDEVGGFHPRTRFGGEETLLSADLRQAGWSLAYVDEIVAFHHPSPVRDPRGRRASELWNRLLLAWLRYPSGAARRVTRDVIAAAVRSRCWPLVPLVARNLPATLLRERAVARPDVLRDLALVGELPIVSPSAPGRTGRRLPTSLPTQRGEGGP